MDVDFPTRPRQNDDARYHIIEVGRGSERGLVAVTSTEALRRSLDPWLGDSWLEIGLGPFALTTDYLGFRQYLYGHVTGGRDHDIGPYMMDVKKRYIAWRDGLRDEPEVLGVCFDICHSSESVNSCAKSRGRDRSTIKARLLRGVEEYGRINRMNRKYLP